MSILAHTESNSKKEQQNMSRIPISIGTKLVLTQSAIPFLSLSVTQMAHSPTLPASESCTAVPQLNPLLPLLTILTRICTSMLALATQTGLSAPPTPCQIVTGIVLILTASIVHSHSHNSLYASPFVRDPGGWRRRPLAPPHGALLPWLLC